MLATIIKYFRDAKDLLLPRVCAMCGRKLREFEKELCIECIATLPLTYFWRWENNPAKELMSQYIKVEAVVPLLAYKGAVREAMHQFKYHNCIGIGEVLGSMIGNYIAHLPFVQNALAEGIYIVPVPLHKRKERKRGYNQSFVICKAIEKTLLKEYGTNRDKHSAQIESIPHLLKREVFTHSQTNLNKLSRMNNIQNAFGVNDKIAKGVFGKDSKSINIILTDDVLTTGATLQACAKAIYKYQKNRFPNKECRICIATLAIAL